VLARKAHAVRDPDLLCNWLYGIALRTARKARARLARHKRTEEDCALIHPEACPTMTAVRAAIEREHAETLHAEIERLPGLFRVPVVLCYFEGLTPDQAALRLRCPAGTVHSRLARARAKLRRGLTRRGVTLSATALAAALAPRSAVASVSSQLCETTARAAIEFAAGRSVATFAGALASEVLRSMAFHKLRLISLTLVLVGAFATGAGYLTGALARNDEPKIAGAGRQTAVATTPNDAKPGPGRMFVLGRVLDPQGKPVAGATVMASVRVKFSLIQGGLLRPILTEIGHAEADGAGRFRVDAPRTSSSRNDEFVALALAPGFGVGWVKIDPDADQPAADITLGPEQVIQGRLFDVQGRPAQGVAVSVSSIERELVRDTGRPIVNRLFEGLFYEWTRVNDIPAWPKPATTDAEGRFTIHGVGRRLKAALSVIGTRFALQHIDVETDDAAGAKLVTATLEPAKTFTGRVTDAGTRKPVPRARLEFFASGSRIQRDFRRTTFQADGEGRYRANPSSGEQFLILVTPPEGKIYVETRKLVDWTKGAVEQSVDLALDRGATIRGKVVEERTAHPVAGALVSYMTPSKGELDIPGWHAETISAADGSFEFAVVPLAGHLAVQAPNDDFVLREIGIREIVRGTPGGQRVYSNFFTACDPKLNGPAVDLQVALRRGITVSGRIIGPDDRPVKDVWIIGRAALHPRPVAWRTWFGSYHGLAPDGQFELHGLAPESDLQVYFLQPHRKLGAVIHLAGKPASGGPITVRLEPCGAAKARLVNPQGRPIAGYGKRSLGLISLVIAPGPDDESRDPEDRKLLSGEAEYLRNIDLINYAMSELSDALGRAAFPALIPGATYRITDHTTLNPSGARVKTVRKEFTVRPGETLDLGDILLEKTPVPRGG
jgi:RNA polymerase sigma factor (sigma-70 family)